MVFIRKFLISFCIIILLIQNNLYAVYVDEATTYVWSESTVQTATTGEAPKDFLDLSCESAILIEQTTGKVLYEKDSHKKLRPASVTKIMTILLIMEAIDSGQITYDTKVTCSENAASMGGSQIWLEVGETLTVDEMLKAICIVSANDCSVAMAEHLAGTESAFVIKMNERAKELGMNDTCFKNCHGIDEDEHLTSSYDIALMSKELLAKHPDVTKYTTTWMDSLRDGKAELVNTNKLVRTYEGATGLKTGSTSLALYNLSASATRDGMSLIAVVLRAPTPTDRVSNARNLLDYGFSNFEFVKTSTKGNVVKKVKVEKGVQKEVEVSYKQDSGTIVKRGTSSNIETKINIDEKVAAPIKAGDKLGMVEFYLDGKKIASSDLVSNASIDKIGTFNNFKCIVNKWFYLFR